MTNTVNIPQNLGLVVDNRPDRISIRLGLSTDTGAQVANIPAPGYSIQVLQGAQVIQTLAVPFHDRYARAVIDSLPDTIIRDHKQIVAQGLMFPYGSPGKNPVPPATNTYTTLMGTAGMTTAQGATGERWDIGLLPEWDGYALRTGDFGPCLAAAKGFESMPIFRIDESTGRFWDMIAKPRATTYYGYSSSPDFIPSAPPGQWSLDVSHHQAPPYIAYVATGKLRYLESIQAVANWPFQDTPWYMDSSGVTYAVLNLAQMRAMGWHFRSCLLAWKATQLAEQDYPNGLPKPLLPVIYWTQLIKNQLQFIMNGYVKDPAIQTFRYFPDKTSYRPWQFDYVLLSLALAAFFNPTDTAGWVEVFLWAMKNPVDRLSGKSGWPRVWQEWYFARLGPPGTMPDSASLFPNQVPANWFFVDTPGKSAWQQAYENADAEIRAAGGGENMTIAMMDAIKANPDGSGLFINWDMYTSQQLRNVMAAADNVDKAIGGLLRQHYAEFDNGLSYVTTNVLDWEAQPGNYIASRVSIVPGTTITPPPSNPPPTTTGVLHMSMNGNLKVGQSEDFVLTTTDNGATVANPADVSYAVVPDGIVSVTTTATGGTVKALAKGSFTITASDSEGDVPATLTGTVTDPLALNLAWV